MICLRLGGVEPPAREPEYEAEIDRSTMPSSAAVVVMVVGSAARSSFLRRPPDTGKSNDGWRRSDAALMRLSLPDLAPFAAGASPARLRFKAAIRSITGGGVETSLGLMATPFILASIGSRNASW